MKISKRNFKALLKGKNLMPELTAVLSLSLTGLFLLTWGIYADTIYDFSSGAGSDKWAYEKGGTQPSDPNDYDSEASSGDYGDISSSDNARWDTAQATAGEWNSQVYTFTITENIGEIANLVFEWEGFGDTGSGFVTYFYVWNKDSSKWERLDSMDFTSSGDLILTNSTTSASNYIDPATNELTVMVTSQKAGSGEGQTCGVPAECLSGFCVDGYCCDSACGGDCQACNLPGLEGSCTTRPADDNIEVTATCAYCDGSNPTSQPYTGDEGVGCSGDCTSCVAGSCDARASGDNIEVTATCAYCDGSNPTSQPYTGDEGIGCSDDCTQCSAGSCDARLNGDNIEVTTACHACDGLSPTSQPYTGDEGIGCAEDCSQCNAGSCDVRASGDNIEVTATCKFCDGINTASQPYTGDEGIGCSGDCSHCSAGSCDIRLAGDPAEVTATCNICDGINPDSVAYTGENGVNCIAPCTQCVNGSCDLRPKDDNVEITPWLTCHYCDGINTDAQPYTGDDGTNCSSDCTECVGGSCNARRAGDNIEITSDCHICDGLSTTSQPYTGDEGIGCSDDCTSCVAGSCDVRASGDNTEVTGTCKFCDGSNSVSQPYTGDEGIGCTGDCTHCSAGSCGSWPNNTQQEGCNSICRACQAGVCGDANSGTDPGNQCDASFSSCITACVRGGSTGFCDGAGACQISGATENIPSGNVCQGAGVITPVSVSAYCATDEDCDNGDCSATKWYISCNGSGSCRAPTDHTDSYSQTVYADSGYTLTASCGLTGTAACGYSSYNKCSGACQKGRDVLRCDASHNCTIDSGDDWTYLSTAGRVCSGGNEVNPSTSIYCDRTINCSYGSCSAPRYSRGCSAGSANCTDTNRKSYGVWWASYSYVITENSYKVGTSCSQSQGHGCNGNPCKSCSGGICSVNETTNWGTSLYDCPGGGLNWNRCVDGTCRNCSGYLFSDGCSGCAGQGGSACWRVSAQSASCNDACSSYGGCVAANWNDNSSCSVLDWFGTGGCRSCAWDNANYSPWMGSAVWGGMTCYYRRDIQSQTCADWWLGLWRVCVCQW